MSRCLSYGRNYGRAAGSKQAAHGRAERLVSVCRTAAGAVHHNVFLNCSSLLTVPFEIWATLMGGLLLLMGLFSAYVNNLPFTPTMVYLAIGVALGPAGLAVIHLELIEKGELFYRAAEVAVVVSLFTVGLKLRMPLRDPRWQPSLVLAFVSMTATVGLIAFLGKEWLGLPWGAAVLLGAILAPTDPVLASDVQVTSPSDRNQLRTSLSGEAGLNDGTAFPFVMLGLGLLGLHDLGAGGWRWWTIDVFWAISGGLAIGGALGYGTGKLILHLRSRDGAGASLDEYLLLGLIGFSYGLALICHTYGFLAVFASGLAVRAVERHTSRIEPEDLTGSLIKAGSKENVATHPELAPAYMAGALLSFNEQIERILEVGTVLLVGVALLAYEIPAAAWWFVPVLFFIVRPLAVMPVLMTGLIDPKQFGGIAWFGIRGIGSIYYLMFAVEKGLPEEFRKPLIALTLVTVATSIVVHGLSVTPLLKLMQPKRRTRGEKR